MSDKQETRTTMTFDQARLALSQGLKVKLPEWTGHIELRTSGVWRITPHTQNMIFLDQYRDRDDWEPVL